MAATKEQERKALARIKKIVEELGEDSYIGMAFEGCFEVAEENIENDFACSMKQRAEHAESKPSHLEQLHGKIVGARTEPYHDVTVYEDGYEDWFYIGE